MCPVENQMVDNCVCLGNLLLASDHVSSTGYDFHVKHLEGAHLCTDDWPGCAICTFTIASLLNSDVDDNDDAKKFRSRLK